MAKLLLILGLLFVCQLLRAEDQYTDVHYLCFSPYNGTRKNLDERDQVRPAPLADASMLAEEVKFGTTTYGDIPNTQYVLFQCREDLSLADCGECVYAATGTILMGCSLLNEEAVVWYGYCMVRSAYRNFTSLLETGQSVNESSVDKVPNIADFTPILADALKSVIKDAAKGTDGIYFATSETNVTASEKFYSLAQCTGDLNTSQCKKCLEMALTQITDCCDASNWAFVYQLSCQLRYDNKSLSLLKESLAPSPSPARTMLPPADQSHGQSISTFPTIDERKSLQPGIIAAIASAASLGFLLLVGCLCLRRTKLGDSFEKMSEASDQFTEALQDGTVEDISSLEALQVDFSVVKAATSNFSEENKLGEGGFGEVYKGTFPSGQDIAVKRLSKNSQQGNVEFKNEVILLAKLQHRNLVRLLGFCLLRGEKILIYEFLTNSSLDRFLYDPEKRASLDWQLRFKITTGIARGLLYLHEDSRLKIIHRDLKVSNILLDEAMNAKIADFGLAKLFDLDQTQGDTMRIAGTYGYMAPEYALAGQFSVKSDVYSFGVIVLEIVSGQRNSFFKQHSDEGLIHRAWRLWNEDTILELVDPLLDNNYSKEEAKLCIQIGLLCIQEDAAYRPRMATVVSAMNGQAITLPVPNAPHFYAIGTMNNDDMSSSNFDSVLGSEAQHSKSDHSNGELVGNVLDINPR